VLKRERRPVRFVREILKSPIINFFRIRGIYRAEQDEKLGVVKSVTGV
jgi:hypothetical protein